MTDSRLIIPPFEVSRELPKDWDHLLDLLKFYFVAEKITDVPMKQAKLALFGGAEIRKLYFSLLFKVTEYLSGQVAFTYTVECLTVKIRPKSNTWYERVISNSMHQGENEDFRSFVTHLHQQAQIRKFPPNFENEAIADRMQLVVIL